MASNLLFFHIQIRTLAFSDEVFEEMRKDLLKQYHGASERFVNDLIGLLRIDTQNTLAFSWDLDLVSESSLFCDDLENWKF